MRRSARRRCGIPERRYTRDRRVRTTHPRGRAGRRRAATSNRPSAHMSAPILAMLFWEPPVTASVHVTGSPGARSASDTATVAARSEYNCRARIVIASSLVSFPGRFGEPDTVAVFVTTPAGASRSISTALAAEQVGPPSEHAALTHLAAVNRYRGPARYARDRREGGSPIARSAQLRHHFGGARSVDGDDRSSSDDRPNDGKGNARRLARNTRRSIRRRLRASDWRRRLGTHARAGRTVERSPRPRS